METKSISMVKHPVHLVAATMRDRLAEVAAGVDDVESVQLQERVEQADGGLLVVNLWQARPKLPALIASRLRPEMLRWTDRATWNPAGDVCTWEIDPHYFHDHIQCRGHTRYEPAMGGRGTRITFTSEFLLGRGPTGGIANPLLVVAEPILRGLIPKNFQKIVEALSGWLDGRHG
jgi:hypothetical protein